jgi:hypothetical protein
MLRINVHKQRPAAVPIDLMLVRLDVGGDLCLQRHRQYLPLACCRRS